MNKKGEVGFLLEAMVSIVIIVIILGVFSFSAGLFRGYAERSDESILFGGELEGAEFFNYTDKKYKTLTNLRISVAQEKSVEVGIGENGYEE